MSPSRCGVAGMARVQERLVRRLVSDSSRRQQVDRRWVSSLGGATPGRHHKQETTPSRPSGGMSRWQLRRAAYEKKRLREMEMRRGQRVVGWGLAAVGVSCLTYGHSEAVLTLLRDPDVVGPGLILAGAATAIAPSVSSALDRLAVSTELARAVHAQLLSTQRAVEELLREIKLPSAAEGVDDGPTTQQQQRAATNSSSALPSKVLHLRNVHPEASLDEIDSIFPDDALPSRILPLSHKAQALVQLDSLAAATRALESLDAAKPTLRNQRVYAAFSIWPHLTSPPPSPQQPPALHEPNGSHAPASPAAGPATTAPPGGAHRRAKQHAASATAS